MGTPLPPKKGAGCTAPPNIGPCIVVKQLHGSRCTWHGVGLGPGHTVLHGHPTLPKKGAAPPLFGSCLLWPRSPSQLLQSSCCTAYGKCRRTHWLHLANTTEVVQTGATCRIRLNMCFLGPKPKRQIDRFSRFCTAHGRKSLYLQWASLSSKIAPSHWGIWTPI